MTLLVFQTVWVHVNKVLSTQIRKWKITLPALMTAWDFSLNDWGISLPLVTSSAAGKFIEDIEALAKFVASWILSSSVLTSSFLRLSKEPRAWCTANGHNLSKRILLSPSFPANLAGSGVSLATAALKGQLISKCPFGVFKLTKKPTKFFQGFLP